MNSEKKKRITGKIPFGKLGANVISDSGKKGIILHGQINHKGEYYVYPYRNEFKPHIDRFKIESYF